MITLNTYRATYGACATSAYITQLHDPGLWRGCLLSRTPATTSRAGRRCTASPAPPAACCPPAAPNHPHIATRGGRRTKIIVVNVNNSNNNNGS